MSELSILGRTLVTRVHTPAIETWIQRQWIFPEHTPEPVPFRIQLEEVEQSPPSREGTPVTVELRRFSLQCTAAADGWRFGNEAAGVHLQLEKAGSRIVAWGAADPAHQVPVFEALFVAMVESLRASGLLPLHAAVAVREGKATALAGKSAVGKSTTLWRALGDGWLPLAEDFAWLDPDTLIVRGWDRGVRLTPDARERFARDIPAASFRTDDDGKHFFPYELFPRSGVRTAALERVAALARDVATPGGLTPLGARGAVRVWWEMVGVPLDPTVRERVAIEIALLVSRVHRFILRLDSAPPAL